MISDKFFNRLIFVFSLLGFLVSGFLLYEYSIPGPVICPIGGGGCDTVRASQYSSILGISLPFLGIIFYLFMAGLSILRTQHLQNTKLSGIQLLSAVAGFGFGIYLTSLEAFVIKAYCFWCVLSFIISTAILLFAFPARKNKTNDYGN